MDWKKKIVQTHRGVFELFEKGEGPPLVVTHLYSEFNETGDYFANSMVGNYKVILLNLRQCGESERVQEPYQLSLLETIFDVEAVREELGYKQWGFAGHSTGAMLGVVYGVHFSDRIRELILVSGAAREYMSDTDACIYHPNHPSFHTMQAYLETLKRKDLTHKERMSIKQARTKLSLYRPERYDEYFDQKIEKQVSAGRLSYFSRELHIFDVTRKLEQVACRTLVIGGRHDVQCPPLFSIEMAQSIPAAELELFEESNHYPFIEEKEKFQKVLARWRGVPLHNQ
ncbi:alpha/beta fold hydrolase [Halobacillus salinus]|uniref:Alpha/beta hydrolase n=1 Tax=Halobacillus salinus TaxID=192814 RepID=A0A4Z0H5E8_9BACI|nr:alpha/beta hydrolase [Halobacillus salinus]TGB04415.1 alpha/beta hydrolase [Halobacillus salinus]